MRSFPRSKRPNRRVGDVAGIVALLSLPTLFALLALVFPSTALASDAAVGGSENVYLTWTTDIHVETEAAQTVATTATTAPGSTPTAAPGGPPTTAHGEVRRDVPVRPVVELVIGVLIIAGVIVFVRRRKHGQGRPR